MSTTPHLSDAAVQGLPVDYSIKDVADALGMSERWVRARVKEGAEHQRYGHKIKFTAAQVEKLRREFTTREVARKPVTTGPKRKAS